MLSETLVTKDHVTVQFHSCEMSRTGKSLETETRQGFV